MLMLQHRLLLSLNLIVAEVMVEREASLVLADLLHGRRTAACWMTRAEMGWRRHLKRKDETFNSTGKPTQKSLSHSAWLTFKMKT